MKTYIIFILLSVFILLNPGSLPAQDPYGYDPYGAYGNLGPLGGMDLGSMSPEQLRTLRERLQGPEGMGMGEVEGVPQVPTFGKNYNFINSLTVKPGVCCLHLKWIALESETDVTYKVMWGTKPGMHTNSKDVGRNLSYTITGLEPGKVYYMVVVASQKPLPGRMLGIAGQRLESGVMTREVFEKPLSDDLSPIEKEFREKLRAEIQERVKHEFENKLRRELKQRLDEELKKKLKMEYTQVAAEEEIGKRVKEELEAQLRKELEERYREEIGEKVEQELKKRELRQFGYDTFTSSPGLTVQDTVVSPDYTIGPGDVLTVYLSGTMNRTIPVPVNRQGKIYLPWVGLLDVSGLKLGQLCSLLPAEFSKYQPNVNVSVTLNTRRTIQIFILGEVQFPGSYQVSPGTSIVSALMHCGGVTREGSLRDIRLVRNEKTIATFDLYNFLFKGEKGTGCKLQPGDVILVPRIGSIVGIMGDVKEQGIYEFNGSLTLEDLIEMAGGISSLAYLSRIQVERILPHQKIVVKDIPLTEEREKITREFHIQDRDLVKIFSIPLEVRNVVYLEGHVKMPGRYEFKPGMRVSDLISSFDDLLPEPFLTHAQIIRKTSPDFSEEALSFDLGRLLKGDRGQDPELMEGDRIVIHSREEMGELPKVIIKGEVNLPGEYRLLDNMKVKDLIYMAGNLTPNAYKREAEITRLVKTETEVKMSHIVIDLKDALNGSPKDNIPLMENDTLYIRKIPNLNTYGTVKILGQVKFPGEYPLERGERLSTLIRRAGGYTEDAYIEGAYLIKESARKEQQARFDQFVKELEQQMFQEALNMGKSLPGQAGLTEAAAQYQRAFIAGLKTTRVQGKMAINLAPLEELEGSEHDILLEPGDILQIPTRPATVNVVGRVYNQMAISYREGEDVDYYLSMVGGMRKDADKDSIYLIRCNGTVVSKSHKGKGKFIHWDEKSNRWVASGASKNFLHTEVRPGDTIVVPAEPRVSKVSVLFATKDIASMISQTLLSLAALTAIF